LLNITPEELQYKRKLILKFTSHGSIKSINNYFAKAEAEYKQFDLSTHFTVRKIEIKPGTLNVIAHGILASRFGKRGDNIQEVSYNLVFDYVDGVLLLNSFSKVLSEAEKIKARKLEELQQDSQNTGEGSNVHQ
jgi:hypothetical protein